MYPAAVIDNIVFWQTGVMWIPSDPHEHTPSLADLANFFLDAAYIYDADRFANCEEAGPVATDDGPRTAGGDLFSAVSATSSYIVQADSWPPEFAGQEC